MSESEYEYGSEYESESDDETYLYNEISKFYLFQKLR